MFQYVSFSVSDRVASERFYDTVLAVLGVERGGDFFIAEGDRPTRNVHVGFVAPDHERVDEFWRVGTAAGYRSDGEPGPRPEYGDDYYGSFLLDPDGNSAEAVWHDDLRRGGVVDHLWFRVADVAASKRFYEAVAPQAGFRLKTDLPERAQFTTGNGSFSVVAGERPSENLHMAFPAARGGGASMVDPDGNRIELGFPGPVLGTRV